MDEYCGSAGIKKGTESYFAVIEKGIVVQEPTGEDMLKKLGAFRDGQVIDQIGSAGADWGNDCSVQINGKEQAKRQQGLNIVVYSNDTRSVIDSVCFDIPSPEAAASR